MKLAWPNYRLNHWSRRLIRRLFFAFAACFWAVAFTVPAQSVTSSSWTTTPSLEGSPGTGTLVAQAERTILNFSTPNYAVRVFVPAGSTTTTRMNVYRRTAPTRLEHDAKPASFVGAITSDGFLSFESFGSRDNRNVIFFASHNRGTSQARLQIVDQATNQVILTEFANGVLAPNMPDSPVTGALERNTLLGFETQDYAVRVFLDPADNIRKMNVFHKPTSRTLVNGQVATPDLQAAPPYECWINYYGGREFNGISARYYARVNASGQALLDVIDVNGAILLSQPRTTAVPLTTNVPASDRPQCFGGQSEVPSGALAPWVAAVFGGDETLQQVRQALTPGSGNRIPGSLTCVIEPRFESARQGQFINAGECTDRNDAGAVVNFLRARGFNSRLVYRNFRYR